MKYTTIPTLVMILGSSFGVQLSAQESVPATPIIPPASAEAQTAGDSAVKDGTSVKSQIEVRTKAYDQKSNDFVKRLRAEKDRAKQREIFKDRPSATADVDFILKLAEENPETEGVEQGLVWSVRRANAKQLDEIGGLLLKHYKNSAGIGILAQSYSRMRNGGEDKLREFIEKAGDEKVRQGATYYLASMLAKKDDTKAEALALMKKLQQWPEIGSTNPKLLAQVEGKIFVAEKLSVGCEAPDIVGTDHEGKEFKLSDYRGQVVLLDFWGIW